MRSACGRSLAAISGSRCVTVQSKLTPPPGFEHSYQLRNGYRRSLTSTQAR